MKQATRDGTSTQRTGATARLDWSDGWMLLLGAAIALQMGLTLWRYGFIFGGDPEIHMIFARNLLDGHPLQFNAGEYTSGETSPLYMVVVAAITWVAQSWTPVCMKLLGAAGLAFTGWNIYLTARTRTAPRVAALYVLCILSLPFFLFQAVLGMENILFAAVVSFVLRRALVDRLGGWLMHFLLPALLLALRPEAVLLMAALFVVACSERRTRDALFVVLAGGICVVAMWLVQHGTGAPLHGAGAIRAYTSRLDSLALSIAGFVVYVNKKPLTAVMYVLPAAALMISRWRHMDLKSLWFVLTLFLAPLALHLFNVFPSTHFSRYFLYCYAAFFLIFGAKILPTMSRPVLCVFATYLLVVGFVEQVRRSELGRFDVRSTMVEFTDAYRSAYSDELIAAIRPERLPVSVALQEVQVRGRLDDRFVVRSLDGIVDYRLAEHIDRNGINHFDYIRDRGIDVLLEIPTYSADPAAPTLRSLATLSGDPIRFQGLCFQRLKFRGSDIYKVVPCP